MYQVIKRDGKTVDFDITKISAVITKAFEAQQMPIHPGVIDFLALKVTADFASKIESIEKQKELIAQSIKEAETLFNSRMDYYFN